MKAEPNLSVCIPVFQTEPFLAQCLRSVITQDFSFFEIVVVSDASDGKDLQNNNARKIVRLMQKECRVYRKKAKLPPVQINFIEHSENRGVFEVRRTLCYNAKGEYICYVDSDDELEPGALTALYEAAIRNGSDITHGASTSGFFDRDGNFIPSEKNHYNLRYDGTIEHDQIFNMWLMGKTFTGMLWSKLFSRELLLKVYDNIPYTECNMADDFLLMFFIAQYANRYAGISSKIYRYRIGQGMSTSRKIKNLTRWKMVCSAASVFSIISLWIQDHPTDPHTFTEDEILALRHFSAHYVQSALTQLRETVIPELQDQAYQMLCEFWGKSLVDRINAEEKQQK